MNRLTMAKQPEETYLIQKYLAPLAGPHGLGLADDAACMTPKPGMDLVFTTDTIVANIHFLPTDTPFDIAIKAITVNASDLIAKGAMPGGYLVGLTLPNKPDEYWMKQFAAGLAIQLDGQLFGGDLTVSKGGPLTISVTAIGEVPTRQMVRRNGAKCGDLVFVAGNIGTKAAGLKCALDPKWAVSSGLNNDQISELIEEYTAPIIPFQKELASMIRDCASASLDISDGLVIDLNRLCAASRVSAEIDIPSLPFHPAVAKLIQGGQFSIVDAITGGDDYLPLFTVAKDKLKLFLAASQNLNCTQIGEVTNAANAAAFRSKDGSILSLGKRSGYDHFSQM